MPKNLTCFISHNSKDKPFANRLCATLESQGITTWYDKKQIFAGDSITDKVQYGLQNYDIFIIILSKNSINAPWVKEELRVAYQNRLSAGKKKRIIPLLLDDCKLPVFLKDYLYIPFKRGSNFQKSVAHLLDAIIFDKEYLKQYKANYSGGFVVNNVKILLDVVNRKRTVLSEKYLITSLKQIPRITKDYIFDGQLQSVSFDSGVIERKLVRQNTERWELVFDKVIQPRETLSYNLECRILDEFKISTNWFYSIDSPMRIMEFGAKFRKQNCPRKFIVRHYQTLTKMKEKVLEKQIIGNDVYFLFKMIYPTYKDRFEFEWY